MFLVVSMNQLASPPGAE